MFLCFERKSVSFFAHASLSASFQQNKLQKHSECVHTLLLMNKTRWHWFLSSHHQNERTFSPAISHWSFRCDWRCQNMVSLVCFSVMHCCEHFILSYVFFIDISIYNSILFHWQHHFCHSHSFLWMKTVPLFVSKNRMVKQSLFPSCCLPDLKAQWFFKTASILENEKNTF